MTSFENVVAYIVQSSHSSALDNRAEPGANFDPLAMCEHCRDKRPIDQPRSIGNVSFFVRCRYRNGCVVCSYCGAGRFDSIGYAKGIPDCPECGAVTLILGSQFMDDHADRLGSAKHAYVEWHRKMRCLDVIAAAAGVALFMSREDGQPISEDEMRSLLYSALEATRLPETDECVNRFFDRLQDTLREVEQRPATARLKVVASDGSPEA